MKKETDMATLLEKINSKDYCILDFFSNSCEPCKKMVPIVEEFATNYQDTTLLKIDVIKEIKISDFYKIRAIPTLIMMKKEKILDKVIGIASGEKLKEKFENVRRMKC